LAIKSVSPQNGNQNRSIWAIPVKWKGTMSLTKQQALDLFRSDDLIGLGMEADSLRRKQHPEGVATYIIDRNINYTNFCT
jgi:2-iminoacetate synthase ThiH